MLYTPVPVQTFNRFSLLANLEDETVENFEIIVIGAAETVETVSLVQKVVRKDDLYGADVQCDVQCNDTDVKGVEKNEIAQKVSNGIDENVECETNDITDILNGADGADVLCDINVSMKNANVECKKYVVERNEMAEVLNGADVQCDINVNTKTDPIPLNINNTPDVNNENVECEKDVVDENVLLSENVRYNRNIEISVLNVNGWTVQNSCLRSAIVDYLYSDIICINETHVKNEGDIDPNYLEKIEVENYAWLGTTGSTEM